MLSSLSIRDLVLIESADLDFGPGLDVLTGETGAGKSILLDALGLALGARADSLLVRPGQDQAVVSATFEIPPAHDALKLVEENGLAAEPGEPLIIRRTLRADGGSRAFVNDGPVSATLLREIGATLVEIHGQHDERGLLNPRGHRALLDDFGEIDLARVTAAWETMRAIEAELEAAHASAEEAERDRDWLAHAVDELRRLAPRPGEEKELAKIRADMQAGARLGDELATLAGLLGGSEGGLALLRQAARRLDRFAGEHDQLGEALAAIDRAVIEAAEAEDRLEQARRALEFDPARLDEAETRLFDIRALARKHRVEPDALPALETELGERLSSIEAGGEKLKRLEASLAQARDDYARAARAVSEARRTAASRLDAAVGTELPPLKLEQARFRTAIGDADPSPAGTDRVEFEVSTNPGAPFGPLVRIASGGELSRFILALKVALHQQGGSRTIVFDEIDRGVGGAVASAVGERLHRLAGDGQVLVVTHSPQVAARGSRHLLIEKSHDGLVTRTSISALDSALRREEIARMLSGASITEEARAQAERLLEAA